MTSPCGKIRIPINESADDKSQIQEYLVDYRGEGIQHVALGTDDIYATVETLREQGVAFQDTPDTYYEALPTRLPGHREDTARLAPEPHPDRRRAGAATRCCCRSSRSTVIGPIFFEIIQRKGNAGLRRRQLPGAFRVHRTGPDPPRRAEGLIRHRGSTGLLGLANAATFRPVHGPAAHARWTVPACTKQGIRAVAQARRSARIHDVFRTW